MATFRCSVVIVAIGLGLACTKSAGQADSPAGRATRGGRLVGDSGRAAFMVRDP